MLTQALGSPLNMLVPDQIAENLERFRSMYRKHHLSGQVFFAHKANRSSALLRRLAATDAGVDVASLGELQHALGAGFGADRIVATGAENPEFLWLTARAGGSINPVLAALPYNTSSIAVVANSARLVGHAPHLPGDATARLRATPLEERRVR